VLNLSEDAWYSVLNHGPGISFHQVVMANVGDGLGSRTSTGAGGAPQLEERIGGLEAQATP
jgi:hypothetical protein